jgi:hypothetical protein
MAADQSRSNDENAGAVQATVRLARAQALPGIGPVLRPGQACLCGDGAVNVRNVRHAGAESG